MANAVVPIIKGIDYQARNFWLHATRLFSSHSKVSRVGFESEKPKGFDDVTVHYSTSILDERGNPFNADFYQYKYHVDYSGSVNWQALMDPAFIGADSFSFLKKLREVQREFAPDGSGCCFHLVTPWIIDPADPLSKLIGTDGGEIRIDVLSQGKTGRSVMGKIRKAWREHLSLDSDEELIRVLMPLRIHANGRHFAELHDQLNDKLMNAGLRPVEEGTIANAYDDLIRKLRGKGISEFGRDDLLSYVSQAGLWVGNSGHDSRKKAVQLGARSFLRWAEHMEDETDHMICLLPYFDNRAIRESRMWSEAVYPTIEKFVSEKCRGGGQFHLLLDAHSTIAYAAGYCLDQKSGVDVSPVQRTRSGKRVWTSSRSIAPNGKKEWAFREIRHSTSGYDVALALSVTHDIEGDVRQFVEKTLPSVGRILSGRIGDAVSDSSIRDGTHALRLAQELSQFLKTDRTDAEKQGVLHIFAAAPNGLMFYLGQLARSFGRCALYEYDFEKNALGAYQPSLTFPPAPTSQVTSVKENNFMQGG